MSVIPFLISASTGVIDILFPKQPQLPLLPVLIITKTKYKQNISNEITVSFIVNRFINNPKMSKKPIKNSKPIINLAIKGAVLHPAIPISTNVNSKGSIGSSFAQPL